MKEQNINILQNLIEIPSPSGYENDIAKHIKKYLSSFISEDKIEIDFRNNVIVKINKGHKHTIIIDAHLDQLGFLVNNITKDGYISICSVGGYDRSILRGRKVVFIEKPNLKGVIGAKPVHLIENTVSEIPSKVSDLNLDIGIRKYSKISKLIKPGDPLIFQPSFTKLNEDYVVGDGFDDKAGCFILIQLIKALVKENPKVNIVFTFSSREEIGCLGAIELARRFKPDLYIGIDVGFATDVPDANEKSTGKAHCGNGLVISRGIHIHKKAEELLTKIANSDKNIKVQYEAANGRGGTNARSVATELNGIPILDLGIPLRYMHTQVEMLNLKDLEMGIRLLNKFLLHRTLRNII